MSTTNQRRKLSNRIEPQARRPLLAAGSGFAEQVQFGFRTTGWQRGKPNSRAPENARPHRFAREVPGGRSELNEGLGILSLS
jgi:hypothetical protein